MNKKHKTQLTISIIVAILVIGAYFYYNHTENKIPVVTCSLGEIDGQEYVIAEKSWIAGTPSNEQATVTCHMEEIDGVKYVFAEKS